MKTLQKLHLRSLARSELCGKGFEVRQRFRRPPVIGLAPKSHPLQQWQGLEEPVERLLDLKAATISVDFLELFRARKRHTRKVRGVLQVNRSQFRQALAQLLREILGLLAIDSEACQRRH